jgi:hypothetical protein
MVGSLVIAEGEQRTPEGYESRLSPLGRFFGFPTSYPADARSGLRLAVELNGGWGVPGCRIHHGLGSITHPAVSSILPSGLMNFCPRTWWEAASAKHWFGDTPGCLLPIIVVIGCATMRGVGDAGADRGIETIPRPRKVGTRKVRSGHKPSHVRDRGGFKPWSRLA